jgi:hypothetical protein
MVASTGATGLGVQLKIGNGASPEVFTTVANVVSINLSGRSVEEVDFTHLLSSGGYREFRAGFKDPGELQFSLHYNPANATHNGTTGIESRLNSGVPFTFKIDLTGIGGVTNPTDFDKVLTGTGYVSGGDFTISGEDPLLYDVTIRVSGAITEGTT